MSLLSITNKRSPIFYYYAINIFTRIFKLLMFLMAIGQYNSQIEVIKIFDAFFIYTVVISYVYIIYIVFLL